MRAKEKTELCKRLNLSLFKVLVLISATAMLAENQ